MRLAWFGLVALLLAFAARADEPYPWVKPGATGQPEVQLYFFWSLTCPHCTAAHPHVEAIPQARPWVKLHALELSRNAANAREFQSIVERSGAQETAGVPAFLFCGEMYFGWDSDAGTGEKLRSRLDACHARVLAGQLAVSVTAATASETIDLPFFGALDAAALSLPALTLVLAGLDAFNPCAFFVLLFLLSMMAHQKSRARMLLVGGVFVMVSGLMYFAFMAAWLNVFQLFGHLAWVTLVAGVVAVFVGAVNVKDYFWFKKGISLSIPAAQKADIFRRVRDIQLAERTMAMLAATVVLAVAANFYELLCTAGFPMVYTRLLTLAELPAAGRYAYLALYNLIYVVPLAVIVFFFVRSLGARKLGEREGRLLKLLSGLMMLGLGALLLLAPERISQIGIAFGLMAMAVVVTFIIDRFSRSNQR